MLIIILVATFFVSVGIFCIMFFIQEIGKSEGFGELLACVLFLAIGSFCMVMAVTMVVSKLLETIS